MKEKYTLLLPTLTIAAAIVFFPTVFLLYVSFQKWILFSPSVDFFGLGNFAGVLSSQEFLQSLWVTTVFISASTFLTLFIGFVLALIFNEDFMGKGLFRVLFTLPAIIPPVVAGFTWKFLLNGEVGLLGGYILPALGYKTSILGNHSLALLAVIIADVWSKTPLMYLILQAGMQSISLELYEVAEMDGASYSEALINITLPMLKPTIVIALIIRFIDSFNLFETIFVMTRGGPGIATQTLTLLGWKLGFQYYNLGQAASLAVVMLLITIVISQLMIRRMAR